MYSLKEAVKRIKRGEVVVYPTESFFALGADATNPRAIVEVFQLKGRKPRKPIALVAADQQQVKQYFWMTKDEERLARQYWPGAMTILLKPRKMIAARSLAPSSPGLFSRSGRRRGVLIGVRVPAHSLARGLARLVGRPITATSANPSGGQPTKSARRVRARFPGLLVVAGRCGRARKPSTVLHVQKNVIWVIRKGAVNVKSHV